VITGLLFQSLGRWIAPAREAGPTGTAAEAICEHSKQTGRWHYRAIDGSLCVDGDPFRGGNRVRLWRCIRNECRNRTISRAADADTTDPSRIRLRARQGIGDVNPVTDVDEDAARHPELPPFVDESAVLLEDLHTVPPGRGQRWPYRRVRGPLPRRPRQA